MKTNHATLLAALFIFLAGALPVLTAGLQNGPVTGPEMYTLAICTLAAGLCAVTERVVQQVQQDPTIGGEYHDAMLNVLQSITAAFESRTFAPVPKPAPTIDIAPPAEPPAQPAAPPAGPAATS